MSQLCKSDFSWHGSNLYKAFRGHVMKEQLYETNKCFDVFGNIYELLLGTMCHGSGGFHHVFEGWSLLHGHSGVRLFHMKHYFSYAKTIHMSGKLYALSRLNDVEVFCFTATIWTGWMVLIITNVQPSSPLGFPLSSHLRLQPRSVSRYCAITKEQV